MDDAFVYFLGPYRIVHFSDGRPRPYVVVDTGGDWLHEEVSFEAACDWVGRRETIRSRRIPSLTQRPPRLL